MTVQLIDNPQDLDILLHALNDATIIGIDTEFTNLDVYKSRLLLMSLFVNGISYVLDFTKLNIECLKQLEGVLENDSILKVGHNLTVEYKQLYHHARIMMRNMHDTMIADQLILAGLPKRFSLKDVALRRLGIDMDKQIRMEFIDFPEDATFTPEQIQYSGEDAIIPIKIYEQQIKEIEQMFLTKIYHLEMSIIAPTAIMEYTGVPVNIDMLHAMVEPFTRYIESADRAFQTILIEHGGAESITFDRAGYFTVNTNSGDQVKAALQRIGIDIRDSKGKSSLNSKVVQRWDMLQSFKKGRKYKDWNIDYHMLIDDDDVADALDLYLILNNKILRAHAFVLGASKLLSTFVLGLIKAVNPKTKRIHPGFRSLGAHKTGRYSSGGPNFQNLPNDKKLAILGLGQYSIRKAIEASKGRKLIIADYSGIELLILAVLSGDKRLMDEILRGDIHTFVTQNVLKYKEITSKNKKEHPHKLWRDAAKTFSYGNAYGTTGKNIAETLNIMLGMLGFKITPQQGDELIDLWFSFFPDTAAYLESNAIKAVRDLYVTDTWGRRRNWDRASLYADTKDAKWKRLAAGREGKNAPIQGTSATMTKLAIKLLWERLDMRKARLIISVHDELVFEVIDSYVDEAMQIIKQSMEESIALTLPAVADQIGLYEGTSVEPKVSERYDK